MNIVWHDFNYVDFSDVKGKFPLKIKTYGDTLIVLWCIDCIFMLTHIQDCCENVHIEDVCGDLQDLVGAPILIADETVNKSIDEDESQTWTFYKLDGPRGGVTIRWHAYSNGYYSESADTLCFHLVDHYGEDEYMFFMDYMYFCGSKFIDTCIFENFFSP